MKLKKSILGVFISALCSINLCMSGMTSIMPEAANIVPGYDNVDNYVADSIIKGYVSIETGESTLDSAFSDLSGDYYYTYENISEALMEDEGLLKASSFWNLATGVLDGDLSKVSQQQTYEIFLADYLTYDSSAASENGTNYEALIDKTVKYETKVLKELVKAGIASTEKDVIKLIESSDSLDNEKIVSAMADLDYEKQLSGYTGVLDDIKKVAQTAADYYEALCKALALKEVNQDRVDFLLSMKEYAADNDDFCNAVDNIVDTIEGSYAEITLELTAETMADYSVKTVWGSIKNEIPGMSAIELAADGLDLIFNSDERASNNMRLLMQYTAGQYAKQVIIYKRSGYLSDPTQYNAQLFNSSYRNYLLYQEYTSDWAKKYVNALIADKSDKETLSEGLESNITACHSKTELIDKFESNYLSYTKPEEDPYEKVEFNGHYYAVLNESMTWLDAKAYCEQLGGHLATITSQSEQDFIESIIKDSEMNTFWFGLSDDNYNHYWVTEEAFEWNNNINDADVLEGQYVYQIEKNSGAWNDHDHMIRNDGWDYSYTGFICEWDEYTPYIEGDTNKDDVLNVRDCAYIVSKLAKGDVSEFTLRSDFNGDSKVNVRDAASIASYLTLNFDMIDAYKLSKKYTGTYVATQGLTALDFSIFYCDKMGNVEAEFSFYAHKDNPGVPSGNYKMNGKVIAVYDNGTIQIAFEGTEWLQKPSTYLILDFTANIDSNCINITSDDYQMKLKATE